MATAQSSTEIFLARFFTPGWPSQGQCNVFLNGGEVTSDFNMPVAPQQGRSSYTVYFMGQIYQFRKPEERLRLDLIELARTIYGDCVPLTTQEHAFGPLLVYRMPAMVLYNNDLDSRKLTTETAHRGANHLRGTLSSLARIFAKGMNDRPADLQSQARAGLQDEYQAKLGRLRAQVPARFHEQIDFVRDQLKGLFEDRGADTWPMVLGNLGIAPHNVWGVGSGLLRLANWVRVDVCPFGMSEACVDLFLGHELPGTRTWRLHQGYASLKRHFFAELARELRQWKWDERIHVALALGQLLHMLYVLEKGEFAATRLPDDHVVWDYLDMVVLGKWMTDDEQQGRFWDSTEE